MGHVVPFEVLHFALMRRLDDADTPDVLTVSETAYLMRVSAGVVYGLVNSGELPHRRAGRRILISRVRLKGWILGEDAHDDESGDKP